MAARAGRAVGAARALDPAGPASPAAGWRGQPHLAGWRLQLLCGDGPGIFSANGTDISAIIDWGGVRAGSTADDIGCWTAHGATDRIPLPAYTAAFLQGYGRGNSLPAADAAAIPLFQRLRIASRACYLADPDALASVQSWMQRAKRADERH